MFDAILAPVLVALSSMLTFLQPVEPAPGAPVQDVANGAYYSWIWGVVLLVLLLAAVVGVASWWRGPRRRPPLPGSQSPRTTRGADSI